MSHLFCNIHTPDDAQDRTESIRVTISYGSFINQFPTDTIKSIRQLERTYTKICRQNMSILFNEICINDQMLPKYTYLYIDMCVCVYIYIYIYLTIPPYKQDKAQGHF